MTGTAATPMLSRVVVNSRPRITRHFAAKHTIHQ
jgi:hypothetical protein